MARAVPLVVLQLVVGCTGAVEYDSERRRARNSGGSDGGDSGGDSNPSAGAQRAEHGAREMLPGGGGGGGALGARPEAERAEG